MQIVYISTKNKGAIYRAFLAVILGSVLVIWPGAALKYIIMLIGLIFLIIGLISFISAYRMKEEHTRSLAPFSGIGSIVLGLLLLCIPSVFVTVFMYVLGFILVLAAVGQFVTLSAARQWGGVATVSYLFPVLIFIAGLVVLFDPFKSAESVLILFGITAIFYGITDFINQYAIRKMKKANEEKEQIVKMDDSEVEDADYEEVTEGGSEK